MFKKVPGIRNPGRVHGQGSPWIDHDPWEVAGTCMDGVTWEYGFLSRLSIDPYISGGSLWSLCIGAWDWNSSFLSHEVRAKSKIVQIVVGSGLLSFLLFLAIFFHFLLCLSKLSEPACIFISLHWLSMQACACSMSLERSMDFHGLACIPHGPTWVNKQTSSRGW